MNCKKFRKCGFTVFVIRTRANYVLCPKMVLSSYSELTVGQEPFLLVYFSLVTCAVGLGATGVPVSKMRN